MKSSSKVDLIASPVFTVDEKSKTTFLRTEPGELFYEENHEIDEAIFEIQQTISQRQNPYYLLGHYLRGGFEYLANAGYNIAFGQESRRLLEQDQDIILSKAIELIKVGNRGYSAKYEEAILLLSDLHKGNPNNADINYHMGRAYSGLGSNQNAEYHFQESIKKDPNHLLANYGMARLYYQGGTYKNYEKSAQYYERVLEILSQGVEKKNQWLARIISNEILQVTSDIYEDEQYQIAIKLADKALEAQRHKALTFAKAEQRDNLIKIREKSVAKSENKSNTDIYQKALADDFESMVNKHSFVKALKTYDQIDGERKDPHLQYLYGFSLFRTGKSEEASEVFIHLIGTKADNADLQYQLGRCFLKLKSSNKAQKHFEESLQKDPNHLNSQHELARIFLEKKDYQSAFESYLKIIDNLNSDKLKIVPRVFLHFADGAKNAAARLLTAGQYEMSAIISQKLLEIKLRNPKLNFDKSNDLILLREKSARIIPNSTELNLETPSRYHDLIFTKLSNLVERGKPEDALILYEKLLTENVDLKSNPSFLYQGGLIFKGMNPPRIDQAIENFRNAYRLDPADAKINYHLGATILKSNLTEVDGKRARDYISDASLILDHSDILINYELGNSCLSGEDKDYKTAYECYSRVLNTIHEKMTSGNKATKIEAVNYRQLANKIASKIIDFYNAGQDPMTADLSEGLLAIDKKVYRHFAILKEKSLFRIGANYSDKDARIAALSEIEESLIAKKNYEEATSVSQDLINLDSQNYRHYFQKGRVEVLQKKYIEAAETLKAGLEINPDDAKSLYQLGFAQLHLDQQDLAEKSLSKSVKNDPIYFSYNFSPLNFFKTRSDGLSNIAFGVEAYAKAFEMIRDGKVPQEYDAKYLRECSEVVQSNLLRIFNSERKFPYKFQKDEPIFKIIDEIFESPNPTISLNNKGMLAAASFHVDNGNHEMAEKYLSKISGNLFKAEFSWNYKMGVLYQKMDRDDMALDCYRREKSLYHDVLFSSIPRKGYNNFEKKVITAESAILIKMRRYEEAMQEYQTLVKQYPDLSKDIKYLENLIKYRGTSEEVHLLADRYKNSEKIQKEWEEVQKKITEEESKRVEEPKSWLSTLTEVFFSPKSSPKQSTIIRLTSDKTRDDNQI